MQGQIFQVSKATAKNEEDPAVSSLNSFMVAPRPPEATTRQCPAGRVFQYRVGSGRVLDKIPGIGLGSGRVGVSKYAIGYFRVFFSLLGISGYVGYFRAFLGLPIYTRVIF